MQQAASFQIEKGVQLSAPKHGGGGRKPKYPFGQMEIGDSFYVAERKLAAAAAGAWGRKYGSKFTTRTEGNGARIWRVA